MDIYHSFRKGSVRILSLNRKRLVCALVALIFAISVMSVTVFAEENVSEPIQEESVTDTSVEAKPVDTIFEIFNRGEGSTSERLIHGCKVTLVGMLTVFAVLIVLMIVLYIFELIFGRASKKKSETVAAPVSAPAPVAPAAASEDAEEVVVAVATAAIAAARGESECAFSVISITKVN